MLGEDLTIKRTFWNPAGDSGAGSVHRAPQCPDHVLGGQSRAAAWEGAQGLPGTGPQAEPILIPGPCAESPAGAWTKGTSGACWMRGWVLTADGGWWL